MEITTLGIGVDSRPVDKATDALEGFTRGADKAEKAAKGVGDGAKQGSKGVDDLGDALTKASMKGTLAADAIQKTIEVVIQTVKDLYALMSEVGDYQDLADMTGASAVGIAKMQTAADVAGVSMNGLAGYMNQMTRVLSNTDEEGDKAAKALSRVGLNYKDFLSMDPADRMSALGQAMAKYGDSAEKTEVLQALFGRGAKDVAKLMHELGEETSYATRLTQEMITEQDAMNDATAKMQSQAKQYIQFMVSGASPAMQAFKTAVGQTVAEMFGMNDATDSLASNQGVKEFAYDAAKGLALFVDVVQAGARLIEVFLLSLKAVDDAMAAFGKGEGMAGAISAFEAGSKKIKDAWERDLFSTTLQKAIDKQLEGQIRAMADAGEEQLKIAKGESEAQRKAREKAAKDALAIAKKLAGDLAKIDADEEERERKEDLKTFDEKYDNWVKARDKQDKAQADSDQKNIEAAQKTVEKINEKAEALEIEVAQHGKLKSVLEEEKLVIMERDLQEFDGNAVALKNLEDRIAAQKRLIAAMKNKEVTDAGQKQADELAKMFDKTWEQVGQSLSDAIMKGGLDAKELLKRTFKSLVLQPMIMGVMSGMGQGFMGGAVGGATGTGGGGGAMGGMGQAVGSMATSYLFGGVGTAAMAGYTGAAAAGAGTLGAAGAGAYAGLAAIGPAGWVALAALAIYAAWKKWGSSGGGPKVEGSAGAGVDIGRFGNEMDPQALNAVKGLSDNYRRMATLLGSTRTDMQFGVGLSMDPRGDAPSMVEVRNQLGGYYKTTGAGRTPEELAKALSEASAYVMVDALRNSGMDKQMLDYFDKITEGMTDEAKLAAFEQVAAVGKYWKQLQTFGGVLSQFSNISLTASVHLAELSGGVEALGANLATYAQNFLKPEEQASLKYQQIAAQLNEAGSGWTGWSEAILRTYNRDSFRRMVDSLNLENEGDRMRYAALLKISGAFAELNPVLDGAATKAEKLAQAEERYNDALDTLRDAYERQRDVLTETRDAMKSATQSFMDFNKSVMVDQGLTTLTPAERMQALESQYGSARTAMVSGGYQADDISRVEDAARALLQGGREFYASGEEYDALFKRITGDMAGSADVTRTKGFIAESQLNALEQQVGYLVHIDETLLSVDDALHQLLVARNEMYALGFPHAEGLGRVPFNNYPALLHKEEMVLPAQESNFIRSLPDLSTELRQLRQEVVNLRRENRQDAGNTIGATFTATQQAAQVQSDATIRAARQRTYQSRSRPVLA